MVRYGRQGEVWQGLVSHGTAGMVGRGTPGTGSALYGGHGWACIVMARQGVDWQES
nr:MAG TPA: hypothetical protein [Caudoviricetes sp.]